MEKVGPVFDPETIEILRISLDDAWSRLTPEQQSRTSKTMLAERILRAATGGERDPVRLRTYALVSVVSSPFGGP